MENRPIGVREIWDGRPFVKAWPYRNESETVIGYDVRFELLGSGDKKVIPYFLRSESGAWMPGHLTESGRPLYGLHLLNKYPDAKVLVVEGCKCAEIVNTIGLEKSGFIAVSWPGGANAARQADWTPMTGRTALIWPDKDASGRRAAIDLNSILSDLGCTCSTIDIEELGFSEESGEDVADWLERGESPDGMVELPTVANVGVNAADWIEIEPPSVDPILTGIFDTGDKVVALGKSKMRKSFFILQLALSLSSGLSHFLGWEIPRRRRVLLIQYEIKDVHFHKRIYGMARSLGIRKDEIGDYFKIINARGNAPEEQDIIKLVREQRAEVVIFDPLYKLVEGDENSAEDMKITLSLFDRIATTTGAAVIFVHHDKKGQAGDLDVRDRGAGSSVLSRDYDSCLILTEHQIESMLVVEHLLRNYPQGKNVTLRWNNYHFELDDTVYPKPRNSRHARTKSERDIDGIEKRAIDWLKEGCKPTESYRAKLRALGLTDREMRRVFSEQQDEGKISYLRHAPGQVAMVGLPHDIEKLGLEREAKMEVRLAERRNPDKG